MSYQSKQIHDRTTYRFRGASSEGFKNSRTSLTPPNASSVASIQAKAPIQRFRDVKSSGIKSGGKRHWKANGSKLRVSEDGTTAIAQDSIAGSQEMYVDPNRISNINSDLKAVKAPFILKKSGSGKVKGAPPYSLSRAQKTLEQVMPFDRVNTSTKKEIPDDCGNAARTVTGTFASGKSLKAYFMNAKKKKQSTNSTDPEVMKAEIMLDHFGKKITDSANILQNLKDKISNNKTLSTKLKPYEKKIVDINQEVKNAVAEAKKIIDGFKANKSVIDSKIDSLQKGSDPKKAKKIKQLQKQFLKMQKKAQAQLDAANKKRASSLKKWEALMKKKVGSKTVKKILDDYLKNSKELNKLRADVLAPYLALSAKQQEAFDKKAGINRYANPGVGEAYTISSGGAPKVDGSGKPIKTWNFHWGGVIFKSTTGSDNITMENYAGNADHEWYFQMYGVPGKKSRKGQTFHEQHKDVHAQHGQTPTTMATHKK